MTRPLLTTDIRGQMILLGTGTSVGVPVIGCGCDVCQSGNPRNRRTRASAVLGLPGGNLLIDTSPDMREQLLRLDGHRRSRNNDLVQVVEANWEVVLHNFEWWTTHDFSADGLAEENRNAALRDILIRWRALRDGGTIPACDPIGANLVAAG